MDAQALDKAVKEVKEQAVKSGKKFNQAIDLVIITRPRKSKTEQPIDTVVSLPTQVRQVNACAFVDKDMSVQAETVFQKTILKDDFQKYDKKSIRRLVKQNDYFFAEATIMAPVAAKFGKQLTAMNKMPNPRTGTVVTPSTNLQAQLEKVKTMAKLNNKKNNAILVKVGDQKMDDGKIEANVNAVYNTVKSMLLNGENGIKHAYLKSTMGKPVTI